MPYKFIFLLWYSGLEFLLSDPQLDILNMNAGGYPEGGNPGGYPEGRNPGGGKEVIQEVII